MLPDGTSFFRLKYSVSRMSNELGWVMTRLVTSSVVATMFWMVMPVSAFTFLVMSSDLIDGGAEVTQHLLFRRPDRGKAGNGR